MEGGGTLTRIRVGVVGCGSVGERHYLPDLAASPYVDLVAVCDADEARATWVAARHGVARCYTDLDAMLAGSDFELLCNLTPMPLHAPLALKALRAGRHVLNEKPLAVTLKEADLLLEEAARRGLIVTAAPNAVLSPTFHAAAAAIASGEIGKVCAARGRYGHSGPHEPWFYKQGGGALFDLGVYNVVTLTGLLGPAIGVVALSGIAVPRRILHGEEFSVEADDNTTLLLDFGQGVQAVIQTGFVYPTRPDRGAGYDDRATIELLGTRGSINWLGYDWEPHGIELCTDTTDGWETRAVDQRGYTWKNGGSALARSLAEGDRSSMTAEHAYHTLEVMLGALESAASGRRVALRSTFPWPISIPEDAVTNAKAVHG
ncbi:MAG: Gfo/Idh/MocA family protein [Chloroflexota bacterium]